MDNILLFPNFLARIGVMFYGRFSYQSVEIENLRKEILDIEKIPNTSDDKSALKSDMNLFL